MLRINSTTAKKLVIESGYSAVYTDTVKSNGGNSAKINSKKEFINKQAVIFILDEDKKNLSEELKKNE